VRARNPLSDLRYRLTGAVGASPQGEERSAQDLLHEYYHDRWGFTKAGGVAVMPQ
jgi:hypothetical protein